MFVVLFLVVIGFVCFGLFDLVVWLADNVFCVVLFLCVNDSRCVCCLFFCVCVGLFVLCLLILIFNFRGSLYLLCCVVVGCLCIVVV